jgi:hypothetical protein
MNQFAETSLHALNVLFAPYQLSLHVSAHHTWHQRGVFVVVTITKVPDDAT